MWQAGPVDYEVHHLGYRKEQQIYQVNLLKAWWEPEGWMLSPEEPWEELGPEVGNSQGKVDQSSQVTQGLGLNEEQHSQFRRPVVKFHGVFNEKSGRAQGMQHEINSPKGTIV